MVLRFFLSCSCLVDNRHHLALSPIFRLNKEVSLRTYCLRRYFGDINNLSSAIIPVTCLDILQRLPEVLRSSSSIRVDQGY